MFAAYKRTEFIILQYNNDRKHKYKELQRNKGTFHRQTGKDKPYFGE